MAQTEASALAVERSTVLTQAVAETARHLGIGPSDLAPIIGISQPSASKLMNGKFTIKEDTASWQLAALLVRLYRGLLSIVGNSDELAREWLNSRNRAFNDRVPLDDIKTILGLVAACDYIDAHRAPV
jgi:predicted XRE-type DNA-binding protein